MKKITHWFQSWRLFRRERLPVVATSYHQALKKTQQQYFWALVLVILGIAYYSYHYTQQQALAERLVPVVVATTNLAPGQSLEEGDLKLTKLPQAQMPAGSFEATKDLIGQTLIQQVAANEAIVLVDVSETQNPDSITAQFSNGHAFALGEDWLVSKLPALGAGDRVDVLVTNPKATENLSITAASNLQVIAVQSSNGRKNLILKVTAEQAQALLSARGLRLPMQVLVHHRLSSNPS